MMKQEIEYEANINEEIDENISNWNKLEFNIDEKYEYVPKGIIFNIFSNFLYYIIALPILKIITKIVYDLKIEGRENIQNIEDGAVTVSNHVLILDCAMVGIACGLRRVYFTTREESFQIPFVRKLIKLLRAIPIPKDVKMRENFTKVLEDLLNKKNLVHFYPEGELIPYCEEIRNLKKGAFYIATKYDTPIIPMVFKFREPQGIRKIFKRKKDVTLKILKPVYVKHCDNQKEEIKLLKEKTYTYMEREEKA